MKREYPIGLLKPNVREFIIRYRTKKKYSYSSFICLCEIDEILMGSPAHYQDTSFTGSLTFDNILDLNEYKIGYDGQERIEIAVYYLSSYIEDRIAKTSALM